MKFLTLKRLKVGNDWRLPGQEVPEAAGWPNLARYVSNGTIALVSDTDEPVASTEEEASTYVKAFTEAARQGAADGARGVTAPRGDDDGRSVDDLSIDLYALAKFSAERVIDLMTNDELHPRDVLVLEGETRNRKTVMAAANELLEGEDDDEDDEPDSDDEGDDEEEGDEEEEDKS